MDDSHSRELPFWLRAQLFAPKEKATMDKCPQNKHDLHREDEEELYCEECMTEQYNSSLTAGRNAAFVEVASELNEVASELFLRHDDKAAGIVRDLAAKYFKKS